MLTYQYVTLFLALSGNTLLSRRVLPETTVLANMTGHAMWQTFLNQSTAPHDTHTRDGDAYHHVLQVRHFVAVQAHFSSVFVCFV